MKASSKLMSVRKIYDSIVAGKLCEFNSKDPFGIVLVLIESKFGY